jgi:tetratricopeptide (TPR) repeat protein
MLALLAVLPGAWAYRAIRYARVNPDALWSRAEEDFQAGRYEQVAEALNRLGRQRRPTPLDRVLRAQLAMVRNQPDRALEELGGVPDDHHMAAQARLLSGQIELRRNRLRVAEQAFRAGLRLDPNLVQAHRELIYIYGMQLRREELNTEFLALSKLVDLSFDNAFHWCLLRNNSWEPGEVVASLRQYLAADAVDRWSRLALAENYRRMGLDNEAESTLAPLPREDPEANVIRLQIAVDRQEQKRVEELLALRPDDDPALARLRGRRALAQRDLSEAARYFRIAYAADPNNREIVRGLQSVLERLGDDTEARPVRVRARNLDELNRLILNADSDSNRGARDDASLMRALGAVCAALGRDAEARTWYKLAIARNPLDSESQQALFRLHGAGNGRGDPPRPGS